MSLDYTPEQIKMLVLKALEDPVFVAKLKESLRRPDPIEIISNE